MRLLLKPRMLAVHVIALSGIALCGGLGRWQWGRAEVRHSFTNAFYAFEWASFAVILAVVWVRTMLDEVRPKTASGTGAAGDPSVVAGAATDDRPMARVPATPQELGDDEMSAYNAYLRWLADNPRD